jgi:ketopantoate reductase
MQNKTYSIFGAGAAGLYTAWRLLDGKPVSRSDQEKQLSKGDTLELYDWGKYDFSKEDPGTRAAGARVCT